MLRSAFLFNVSKTVIQVINDALKKLHATYEVDPGSALNFFFPAKDINWILGKI